MEEKRPRRRRRRKPPTVPKEQLPEFQVIGEFDPRKHLRNYALEEGKVKAALGSGMVSSSEVQKMAVEFIGVGKRYREEYEEWAKENEEEHIKLMAEDNNLQLLHSMFGGSGKFLTAGDYKKPGERDLDRFHEANAMQLSRIAHQLILIDKANAEVEGIAKKFEKATGEESEVLEDKGHRLDKEIENRERTLKALAFQSEYPDLDSESADGTLKEVLFEFKDSKAVKKAREILG